VERAGGAVAMAIERVIPARALGMGIVG